MVRLLVIVVFLVALITFALSNPDAQSLWIVSLSWQLSAGTLALGLGVGSFLLGGLVMFIGEVKQRSRARKAEQQVRSLESQVLDLHQRLDRLNLAAETNRPSHEASATSPVTP
ncbi:lipopolysaccharide assembly protein LapA domain-containing protein [Asaia astilbis]|uniref:lipopolysaccharide assembly protein LapA domain-containing protein n=1 Tax=Asaia astilbis TaxID=610244 RepID=UPI0004712AC2|nr:lipopolysaccharide assembly protein LapA domain-containing protein [Asaia astilbis]